MKLVVLGGVLALCVLSAHAECPNSCSLHGTCGTNDQCTCYQGFRGNACEQRVCPYGRAWVTTPRGDLNGNGDLYDAAVYSHDALFTTRPYVSTVENAGGTWEFWPSHASSEEGHFDMECSNAGLCDRELGQCQCFEGFEGAACDRSACPGGNYCNGNGRCMTIAQQVAEYNIDNTDIAYTRWDADMVRSCKCDPGYGGIGCQDRLCPKGDDPLTKTHQIPETQVVEIKSALTTDFATDGVLGGTFTMTFENHFGQKFTTSDIALKQYDGATNGDGVATAVQNALEALPNSHIPSVTVTAGYCETVLKGTYTAAFATSGSVSVKPGDGFMRCPGALPTGTTDDCGDTIVELDGTVHQEDADNAGNCPDVAATLTMTGADYSGCTRITTPRCIRLFVKFDDAATPGSLKPLTLDVSKVTVNGRTDDQDVDADITYEVTKELKLTHDSTIEFFQSSESTITDTNSVVNLALGTVQLTGHTPTGADLPAGAKVKLSCDPAGGAAFVSVGTYTVATTVTGLADSDTITFTSMISDPHSKCTGAGFTSKLELMTDFIKIDADMKHMLELNPEHGLRVGTTSAGNLASVPFVSTTYAAADGQFILLTEDVENTGIGSATADLYLMGEGTKEADECSRRGNCDYTTGLCKCFKGYTGERCDSQNALWVGAE